MNVSALRIHPIKGGRAVPVDEAEMALEGLAGDRLWMAVDPSGRFVTQREEPRLALVGAELDPAGDGIHLAYVDPARPDAGGERFVPTPDGAERIEVRVWADTVSAAAAAPADDAALSDWVGRPLRLAFFDATARRLVSREWMDREAPVGFADGFPILVATEASLRAMNREIVLAGGEALPMSRFRPNIVLEGSEPWAEDGWRTIRIGDVVLDLVKPCARCVVTTVDQDTGRRTGAEPIMTLTRTRRSADDRAPGALFGWNAIPRARGIVRVGDPVEVLAVRDGGWPLMAPAPPKDRRAARR